MFSLACNLPKTMPNFCSSRFRQRKNIQTTRIFLPSKLRQVETTWISRRSKLHQKKYVKKGECFDHRNYVKKSKWKKRGVFFQRNFTRKSMCKQRGFFDHWNNVQKSIWKWRGFFNQQNYIKKVRKMTWNSSKFSLQRISVISTSNDIDSMWCARRVATSPYFSIFFLFILSSTSYRLQPNLVSIFLSHSQSIYWNPSTRYNPYFLKTLWLRAWSILASAFLHNLHNKSCWLLTIFDFSTFVLILCFYGATIRIYVSLFKFSFWNKALFCLKWCPWKALPSNFVTCVYQICLQI